MINSRKLTKTEFLLLSFTWGIVLTCIGFLVAGVMLLTGHKAQRYGWVYYFEVGKSWGGCEFGLVFLKDKNSGEYLCKHEFGHAIQNAMYGPFMLIFVNLPSTLRYWLRRLFEKLGRVPRAGYYDIWFEKQASELGADYMADHIKILENSI